MPSSNIAIKLESPYIESVDVLAFISPATWPSNTDIVIIGGAVGDVGILSRYNGLSEGLAVDPAMIVITGPFILIGIVGAEGGELFWTENDGEGVMPPPSRRIYSILNDPAHTPLPHTALALSFPPHTECPDVEFI
jgi:hypothetical protein